MASFELPSCILSNFLWFNKHILIEKKSIFFRDFFENGLNFVYQLFDNNGNVKSWCSIKQEFGYSNISNFKWQQLIYALPHSWKKNIKETIIYYSQILILLKEHIIWYRETKFKAVILSPCLLTSLYTNISEVFKRFT